MELIEFTLPAKAWEGLVTQYPADTKLVSSDQFTEGSYNFITDDTGTINKRPDSIEYNPIAFPTPAKDQYEAVFSSGIRHMLIVENGTIRYTSGGGTFAVPTNGTGFSATSNMEFVMYKNRVYGGNGINNPIVYDLTANYGGVAYTPPYVKDMGCQPPSSAVTFAADTAGGAVPAGAHTYKVTFLYYDAEESNGGPASAVHTVVGPNFTVNLTAIPIGGYGVTARKIYRDNNDGVYSLIATINDNTTVIYSDVLALGTLPIPTNNALPPLFSLIANHRDRLWVAGITDDPSRLYWSEAGQPNIIRINNSLLANPRDPITALYVYNDRVIVFNRDSMGQILGSTSADFRYSEISPSVGCVDTRSVQTRTIRGVPTLVWLSGNNFYQFNGSSINNISEEISSLVRLNIQQAVQVKGKQTQTTQADFTAGTSSAGINLVTTPGSITTRGYMKAGDSASLTSNPSKQWDSEAEWDQGQVISNIATHLNNQLTVPTKHTPAWADGTLSGSAYISADTLKTIVWPDPEGAFYAYSGATYSIKADGGDLDYTDAVAQQIYVPRAGTITRVGMYIGSDGGNGQVNFSILSDAGGVPGSTLHSVLFTGNNSSPGQVDINTTYAIAAGYYWIAADYRTVNPFTTTIRMDSISGTSGFSRGNVRAWDAHTLTWREARKIIGGSDFGPFTNAALRLEYTPNPIASSGQWLGPTHDTYANKAVPNQITHTGVYPSGLTCKTIIEAADNAGFTTNYLSQEFSNHTGSGSVTITDRRYWRIKITMLTNDDRVSCTIGLPVLTYNTSGEWISETIDHTTDITSLDALTPTFTIPSGTSASVLIATSDDNITYTPYTVIGSATPKRYSRIKVLLTTNVSNDTSAVASSVLFNWSLIANLISSAIDTGSTPAGFDIFQSSFSVNGGVLLFQVRTASTLGGLGAAPWTTVSNGAFISATPNQYIQYRATISSSANQVPIVQSVTINWLIQNIDSIRVASLFYDDAYYLAAAEYGSDYNNVIFVYDSDNTWKLWRGINVNTFGTFFTDAYFGSSTVGKMYKFLQDIMSTIDMDVRTKAFSHEIGDESKTKFLRKLVLKYKNTGCRITPSYSVDGGNTFLPLKNITTGLTYIDTLTDSSITLARFVPTGETIDSGKTLMLRLYNNDDKEVQVHSLRASCWISAREVM